jgi:hypothetical protein
MAGAVIFGVIQQWACSETPVQGMPLPKTVPPTKTKLPAITGLPATTGLPKHWQIWPHDPSPNDFVWPRVVDTVDEALATLQIHVDEFYGPDSAQEGDSFDVKATIRTNLTNEKLALLINVSDHRVEENLRILDRVAATLEGDLLLDVLPSGPQYKSISNEESASWTWKVTPKASGDRVLLLSFQKVYTLDGRENEGPSGDMQPLHISVVAKPSSEPQPDLITKILGWIRKKLSPTDETPSIACC